MSRAWATLLLVALCSYAAAAPANPPSPVGTSVAVFSIAKSENRNQVQYVVRVDDHCAPVGPDAVSAYWRLLEKGPAQTGPLLPRELRAYGLASQDLANGASGPQVHAVLRALPRRPLYITTSRGSDGACHALATVSIAGEPSHLFNVYVHLKWDGVDYVLLQGWSMDGSRVIREKVTSSM